MYQSQFVYHIGNGVKNGWKRVRLAILALFAFCSARLLCIDTFDGLPGGAVVTPLHTKVRDA